MNINLFLKIINVGTLCRCRDLSGIGSLKQVVLDSFLSQSEEVKAAASYTLGNVAVGNLPEYLLFILSAIEKQPKRQYLLLHSLKEVRFTHFVGKKFIQSQ